MSSLPSHPSPHAPGSTIRALLYSSSNCSWFSSLSTQRYYAKRESVQSEECTPAAPSSTTSETHAVRTHRTYLPDPHVLRKAALLQRRVVVQDGAALDAALT